jgi:2-polyprenyl-6-methoxyphenol hydroxylase-like FAD-dependent oxidoreductase
MYDAIIVGARSAGAGLGLLLARMGHKVLIVERTTFPSDTMSGHYIHPAGISCLRRWGVFDRLAATDTPPQHLMTFDSGTIALTGRAAPAADGTSAGYGPRRRIFDPLLASAAVEAGVEFQEGVLVKGPIVEDGRVIGIEGCTQKGKSVTARASIVVGADGKRSTLAAAMGARKYHHQPSATCTFYSYWSGFDAPHTHLFARAGRFYVVMPTNEGLTFLGVFWPIAEFARVRSNVERAFGDAVSQIPWIADRFQAARRSQNFIGTNDLEGFFRQAHGPGWALLGDAGYHRDPITAQGMTNAFQHAELLARAISRGFSEPQRMEAELAEYQSERDRSTLPMYHLTNDMARLAPPGREMTDLFEALQYNTAAREQFFGVMAGTTPVDVFFSASNIERIIGSSRAA